MIKDLLNRKEKDPFLADVQSTINSLDGIVAAITQTNSKLQSRLTFAFATKLIPVGRSCTCTGIPTGPYAPPHRRYFVCPFRP